MKLGAIIQEKDPRNLKFHWFGGGLPDPPDEIDWATEMKSRLQMWKNDEYGDCVFAAFYNYLAVATGYTNDTFPYVNEDVLADYTAVTGFDPNDPSTDNGTNPEAALKYYMKNSRILAWGEINHHSLKECKQALDIFGGIYTAFSLPISAQGQEVWDVTYTSDSGAGTWGGHMTMTQAMDKKGNGTTDTWGTTKKFTKAFWDKYCSGAYFFVTEKWVADNTGKTPNGFDLPTLLKDAKLL
jgi:hypothetical protein